MKREPPSQFRSGERNKSCIKNGWVECVYARVPDINIVHIWKEREET